MCGARDRGCCAIPNTRRGHRSRTSRRDRREAEVPAEVAPPAKPSAKHLDRGRSLSGQPVEHISCSSALEIRRVMRDCGRYLPDMARGVLKGLVCARYKIRCPCVVPRIYDAQIRCPSSPIRPRIRPRFDECVVPRIRPRPQAAVHGSTHARHRGAASGTERGGMDG